MPDSDTVAKLRRNIATQIEWSLRTNLPVRRLFADVQEHRPNKTLKKIWATHNPISLSAPRVLREAAEVLIPLEQATDLTCGQVLEAMRKRRQTTQLERILGPLESSEWSHLYKRDAKPALDSFVSRCQSLSVPSGVDRLSAVEMHTFLASSTVRQLKSLGSLDDIDLTDWKSDASVLKRVLSKLGDPSHWVQSWLSRKCPFNAVTGRPYANFYSFLALNAVASVHDYQSNMWASRNQWAQRGFRVLDGEFASPVFHFFSPPEEPVDASRDTGERPDGPLMRMSPVFSSEQVRHASDGRKFRLRDLVQPRADVDGYVQKHGVRLLESEDREAFYDLHVDAISMPSRSWFRNRADEDQATLDYYGTLLHEFVHWTGHESRLARLPADDRGFEELIAELGSGFLCARLGLATANKVTSGATLLVDYINSWFSFGRDPIDLVLDAAHEANRACNFILYRSVDD